MAEADKPERKMTAKQAAFVEEYLRDRNGTQAAIRAGYSVRSAGDQAYELLRSPKFRHVQEAIEERARDLSRSTQVLQESLRRKWAGMALGRPKDILPPEGEFWTMDQLRDLPEETWEQIQSIRQTTYIDHEGREATRIEIRFHNALQAGKLLGTHLGMLKQQIDLSGSIDVERAGEELSGALDSLRASREEIARLVAGAIASEAERVRGGAEPPGQGPPPV